MFIYQASIPVQTLPIDTIEQLCRLWEEIAEVLKTEVMETLNYRNHENTSHTETLRLIVNSSLYGKKTNARESSETSITFASEEMAALCQQINLELGSHLQHKALKNKFSLKLLETMMNDNLQRVTYPIIERPKKSKIQHLQLKQKPILKEVQKEISKNLDYHVIIQITIEQVLHLLELDRIAIYQLNVKGVEKGKLIDAFTYEALASSEIPSILNFQDQIFMKGFREFQEKQKKQLILSIDNVETDPHMSKKLKSLVQQMQIKAKVVIPIFVKESLWGFLVVHQCFKEREWKNDEMRFLLNIRQYLASAIDQAQSYKLIKKQKSILEQQVKKREQELEGALLAAQIAETSKKQFIDTMSHELRTPLTCVLGLSSTLLQMAKNNSKLPIEKQQRYLQIIQDNGKKLLELINEILEISSVEAGKSLLNISNFSLKEITREIVDYFQEQAKKKEINLSLDFQILPEEEIFYGDKERIKQILYNLIENGIKFTPAAGIVILRVFREKEYFIFEVEDTGIGIAENHLPLLFHKFQQLEDTRTRIHEGTGLGLALTKQLVELHGGKIKVESILGKGSLFTVWLPVSKHCKIKKKPPIVTPPILADSKTIVVVESDKEVATVICELLSAANYKVIWLIDSSTAITHIKLLKPQVVIIDSLSPKAYEISQHLKELTITKFTKILLLTSDLISIKGEVIAQDYADDYIVKPLQPSLLLHTVQKCFMSEA